MARRTDVVAPLVDARGLKCPWPALRAARAMRNQDAITLLTDDLVARIDIPALARMNGWTLEISDQGDHVRFGLKKAD